MELYVKLFIIVNIITLSPNTRSLAISHDPAVHLYLQEGSRIKLGKGDDSNDLPIIECTNSEEKSNCTITTVRSEKHNCGFVLPSDDGMADMKVDFLYQFPDNKVIVVWHRSRDTSKSDNGALVRDITVIDITNCTNITTLTFPKNSENWRDLQVIVLYKNSFDVIEANRDGQRIRINYDLDGNAIETLSVSSDSMQHGRGDEQVKDVLTFFNDELQEQKVTCTDRFNTICAQQTANISKNFFCVQMSVNQPMYRQELYLPENTQIISVRNFEKGGMILFGLENDTKLIVAEIRLGYRPKILTAKLKWPINKYESAIVDFREKRNDLHFTLIGETNEFNHSIVMQFFRLIDKSAKHHRRS